MLYQDIIFLLSPYVISLILISHYAFIRTFLFYFILFVIVSFILFYYYFLYIVFVLLLTNQKRWLFYALTLCKETQSVPYWNFNFWSSFRFLLRDHSFRACVLLKWRNRQFVDQTFTRDDLVCGRGLFPRPYSSLWLFRFTSYKLNNSNIEFVYLAWVFKNETVS